MFKKNLILIFLFLSWFCTAETQTKGTVFINFYAGLELGGSFLAGGDADYAPAVNTNLLFFPGKINRTNGVKLDGLSQALEGEGYTKTAQSISYLNGAQVQKYFLAGNTEKLLEWNNSIVTESIFEKPGAFGFGITSGYGQVSFSRLEEVGIHEEHVKYPMTYVPLMASFQHNVLNDLDKKKFTLKTENGRETEWTLNSSLYGGYRLSAGVAKILESEYESLNTEDMPFMFRIDLLLGERKNGISSMNFALFYHQIFATETNNDSATTTAFGFSWNLLLS